MANVNFHGYTSGGGSGAVDSVNGKTGAVILYGSNIDVSSGDNTKISTALNGKADTADLATVAFTGDYEDLTGTPSLSTVAITGDYDDLLDKPTLSTVASTGDYDDLLNKPSLATVATTGDYDDLTDKPNLATVATTGDYDDLTDKPNLATVATTGDYDDLIDKPNLAPVATTGNYNDLSNKPTIPITLDDLTDVTITAASNGQVLSYSSGAWINTTLSGGGDMLASTYDPSSAVATAGGIPDYVEDKIAEATDVTTFAVSTTGWTADTTSQSGTTLYKKSISLTHVYVESPSVDIGAGTGYVLPTAAEQTAYDLLQYATIDGTTLYLYASNVPTTAFYISVGGAD